MADQGSEGLLSPYLRRKRIAAVYPYIYGRVLDVGCGSGEVASLIPPYRYVGVDIDDKSLSIAKNNYPSHRFYNELPPVSYRFDTILALAVIEHVNNPEVFLQRLVEHLTCDPKSKIVLTTPHPVTSLLHYLGSRIGVFSKSGNEEHENLYNKKFLETMASKCGFSLALYQRFLLGMNQLVIYQKKKVNCSTVNSS